MTNDLEMLKPLLKKEVCVEMEGRYFRAYLEDISESFLCLRYVYLVNLLDNGEDDKFLYSEVFLLKSKVLLIVEVVRDGK